MAESIHMLELPIEIEPLRPRPKRWSPFMPDVGVSAAVVEFCARIAAALRKLLKDFAGPPMEVGIDDPHAGHSVLCLALILNLDRRGRRLTNREPCGLTFATSPIIEDSEYSL